MAADVLSADGRVVHFPPAAVAACATLAHVTQHCPAGSVPVPFAADTLERFLAALEHGAVPEECSAVPGDVAAELVVVADYLDCAALMQPLCRRLAGSDLSDRDFSLELWSCIAEHLTLPAGCALALQRPELADVLRPRLTALAQRPELTDVLRPRLLALARRVTLDSAASDGHLAVCQWMTEEFGLTADDNGDAFRRAAQGGHLAVCQWLTEKFGLTAADVRKSENYTFLSSAARHGHLAVCQWMVERFGLTADDASRAIRWCLPLCDSDDDQRAVVEWLVGRFGLEKPEENYVPMIVYASTFNFLKYRS